MIHTGGQWDSDEKPIYFIAGDFGSLRLVAQAGCTGALLVAMNEIDDKNIEEIKKWAMAGIKVFIDSGVFSLAMEHARTHKMPLSEAIALPPQDIDGFDALLEKYTRVVQQIGRHVWGYIEIDQGGHTRKRQTRADLESKGLKPIPVYHPMSDGCDYFDELAQNYDRICIGNLVTATAQERLRFLATAWAKRLQYPGLWIHMLGMTPNEWQIAFPANSSDSSSWLRLVRWSTSFKETAALKPVTGFSSKFVYQHDAHRESDNGHQKCRKVGAYNAHFMMANWRAIMADYENNQWDMKTYNEPEATK